MEELIKKSNEAIRHYDDVQAIKLLKEWGDLLASQNIERNNPQLFTKVQRIIIGLKIAAFPLLPEHEACDILRFHFIESFDIEVFMDNRLLASLFSIPEIPRDTLREKYKKAFLENNQKLGHLSVSQWINLFEKKYSIMGRSMSAPLDFVMSDIEAKKLSPITKERLKETLYFYDHYLVITPLNTGIELNEMVGHLMSDDDLREDSNAEYSYQKYARHDISTSNEANNTQPIGLNEALNNYPLIGEQLITSQSIKIQNFPQPVRPSIKNWVSDYTFVLGHNSHSSVERANYLFRTQNTQRLSNEDRERLGYILKAFDEKTPVSVDTANRQIVFPDFFQKETGPSTPTSQNIPKEEPLGNVSRIQYVTHANTPSQHSSPLTKKESIPTLQQNRNTNTLQTNAPQQYTQKQPQINASQSPVAKFSVSPSLQQAPRREEYNPEKSFDPFRQNAKNIYQNSLPKKFDSAPNARVISQNTPEPETRKPEPIKILPVFREEKKEEKQSLPKNVVNLKDL